MTCHRCTEPDKIREEARVAALEQQNTDLIKITMKLIEGRLDFKFMVDPNMHEVNIGDYRHFMATQAATQAKIAIERMLEDRRQFFRDYYLLKATASPEYYREINEELFR